MTMTSAESKLLVDTTKRLEEVERYLINLSGLVGSQHKEITALKKDVAYYFGLWTRAANEDTRPEQKPMEWPEANANV
jgi:hypothetical protein